MITGSVRWFNAAKGFGWIIPDTGGQDIFVRSASPLKEGQKVAFNVMRGPGGKRAVKVTPCQ